MKTIIGVVIALVALYVLHRYYPARVKTSLSLKFKSSFLAMLFLGLSLLALMSAVVASAVYGISYAWSFSIGGVLYIVLMVIALIFDNKRQ